MTNDGNPDVVGSGTTVSSAKVFNAIAWLTASKFLSYGLSFISTIILARLLMPDDFGVMAMSIAIVGVTSAALELPVTMALIQLDSPSEDDFNTAWTLSILRAIAIALLLMAVAAPIGAMLNMPNVVDVVMVLAAQPLIFGLRNPHFERFARDLKFSWDIIVEICSRISQVGACIAVAIIWQSYWAFVVGMLVSSAVGLILTYIAYPRWPAFSLKSSRRLFGFSAWLGLGAMVNQLNAESSKFVIASTFGQTVLGQFSIASKLSTQISQFLLIPITRSLFSAFSRMGSDIERVQRAYLRTQSTTFAVVMPASIGLGLLADLIVPPLLGEKWLPAVVIIQVYAPTMALTIMTAPIRSLGMALNRTRELLYRDVIALVLRIAGLTLGAYYFGFIGFLIAYCLTTIVIVNINLIFLSRFVHVSVARQITNVARSLVSAAIMSLVVFAAKQWIGPDPSLWYATINICSLSALGATTYVVTHYVSWVVCDRPDGPEAFVIGLLKKLVRRP